MTTQVNSDKAVTVDARVKQFVEDEANRVLKNLVARLTRVEVHLSDVNSRKKSGPADKRCVVEARPAGAGTLSTTATAATVPTAVTRALRKMQRLLTSYFGRHARSGTGRPRAGAAASAGKRAAKGAGGGKEAAAAPKASVAGKAAAKKGASPKRRAAARTEDTPAASTTGRSAKKTPIFQARRKAWPAR